MSRKDLLMLAIGPATSALRPSMMPVRRSVLSRAVGLAKATAMKERKKRTATDAILVNCMLDEWMEKWFWYWRMWEMLRVRLMRNEGRSLSWFYSHSVNTVMSEDKYFLGIYWRLQPQNMRRMTARSRKDEQAWRLSGVLWSIT
jgi:hypothetical protein